MGTVDSSRPIHLHWRYLGLVAAGGAVGTALREALSLVIPPAGGIDLVVLGINIVGAFALGVLLERLARRGADEGRRRTARLLLGTGVLGGFTTYSTLATDASTLIAGNQAWLAIAYATVAGIGGVASGALDSIELASVPVALALLASGALVLARTPSARSWAWLAPGITVLLVPSLLATAVDAPLWRLVGLGVASVAVVIAGVGWRLQAPFLIGAAVAFAHAIATFSPQIRLVYESVEWWLWLAVGGVIIVVLSARFEKSMRGLATLATRIRSLR